MKTKLRIVGVACAVLFAAGCGSSPSDLIVGKWETGAAGMKITAEFTSDARANLTMLGNTVQGTYKVNGDELEWTLNGSTTKSKMKVSPTELEVTKDGATLKYKRA
jgi:hypothetical protein